MPRLVRNQRTGAGHPVRRDVRAVYERPVCWMACFSQAMASALMTALAIP